MQQKQMNILVIHMDFPPYFLKMFLIFTTVFTDHISTSYQCYVGKLIIILLLHVIKKENFGTSKHQLGGV